MIIKSHVTVKQHPESVFHKIIRWYFTADSNIFVKPLRIPPGSDYIKRCHLVMVPLCLDTISQTKELILKQIKQGLGF